MPPKKEKTAKKVSTKKVAAEGGVVKKASAKRVSKKAAVVAETLVPDSPERVDHVPDEDVVAGLEATVAPAATEVVLVPCDDTAPGDLHIVMEMRTIQGSIWKILAESLKEIVNDCNLQFSPDGIRLATMDSSRVSLCSLKIHGNKLERYYCDKTYTIGICTKNLWMLLKQVGAADQLVMRLDSRNMDNLTIIIENADRQSRTVCSMKLLDIDEETISIPDKDIDVCVNMLSSDFHKMVREMKDISETMRIRTDKATQGLIFSGQGDIGEISQFVGTTKNTDFCVGECSDPSIEIDEEFSLRYLQMFTRCSNLCNCVRIYLEPRYPLMLKYDVGNSGELVFALAPKMKDTDFGDDADGEGEGAGDAGDED